MRVTADDGHPIDVHEWAPAMPARAMVLISHGMGEHGRRYRQTAAHLNSNGLHVFAHDHRGHGQRELDAGRAGDLGAGGFEALVDDIALVCSALRARHPALPLVLLGHSMGSFAAQIFVTRHSALIDALVLSGSAALDLRETQRRRTESNPAPVRRLESYNAAIPDARTPFDWLSRDPAVVDAYLADPLCGHSLDVASRRTMVEAALRAARPDLLRAIAPSLPVLILSGECDPVNDSLRWHDPLVARYQALGLDEVSARVYPGARHEILNETNRDEVHADLVAWIDRVSARRDCRDESARAPR
ncbi:MAG: alpha/beta hydrolase [Burkholderiaceae bacterium]|nr:alpha/beta hydrolase [Burkholderiaceae bacterium]